MEGYHVLIVEDQRELARMLRTGLSTLSPNFDVVDVPSGEEALLVASRQSFDLVVLDIGLPGISGLTLMEKIKSRQPDAKVILFTGTTDHKLRRQVANAGADAFFFKPVELGTILETVDELLDLSQPPPPAEPIEEDFEAPEPSLSDFLLQLRQDLDAIAVFVLDERGQSLVQAGDLPTITGDTSLLSALMIAFSASEKVSHLLGKPSPEDVLRFSGQEVDLTLTHLDLIYALLIATPPDPKGMSQQSAFPVIRRAVQELREILSEIGVPGLEGTPTPSPQPEQAITELKGTAELEEALSQASEDQLDPQDVDSFWDSSKVKFDTGSLNPETLSYDQARKLGLTPEDD